MKSKYGIEHNTVRCTIEMYSDDNKTLIDSTEFIIWMKSYARFEKVEGNCLVFEIYRRLRKFPEFEGPVAILFPQTVYAICAKHGISLAYYESEFEKLVNNEIVSVIVDCDEYKVVSLDRSIFVTNALYYKESGTDAKACAEYFLTEYEKVDKTNKAG